jgi:hypothetical protein
MTADELADVRRRHVSRETANPPRAYCVNDNQDWPCDVARCLDAIDQARGDAAALASATWQAIERAELALAAVSGDLNQVKVHLPLDLAAGP